MCGQGQTVTRDSAMQPMFSFVVTQPIYRKRILLAIIIFRISRIAISLIFDGWKCLRFSILVELDGPCRMSVDSEIYYLAPMKNPIFSD